MATKRRASFEPRWVLVFVFFVAGVFGGALCMYLVASTNPPTVLRVHYPKGKFQYTNPTLVSEALPGAPNTASKALELQLDGIVSAAKKRGVNEVGLYYRDLDPAKWIDLNADMQFSPGKLLKMPLMISYFRSAEINPAILQERVVMNNAYPKSQDVFAGPQSLVYGQSYSVSDLITSMVVDSDDAAANTLFDHIDKTLLNETFSDLGINFIEDKTSTDYISIRRYSFFFRALYNATLLSPEYSDKALSLLAQHSGDSMLGTNLPSSLTFVSRVGSSATNGSPSTYECDIVYYPSHDYLLCAVATDEDMNAVKQLFAAIGDAVYKDTVYRYGGAEK